MATARKDRTPEQQQVAELLRTARRALGLSLTFLSRLDGVTQHLEVVESALPMVFKDGVTQVQETSLCQAILEGHLPPVMPDLRKYPEAMALPAAGSVHLRSYISVPVTLSDGSLYGTFCAAGFVPDAALSTRDRALMEVLAQAAAVIVEPQVRLQREQAQASARFTPLLTGEGLEVVLQPLVALDTGHRVGAEALSRFPADWQLPPDVCFEQSHRAGLGEALELLALRTALAQLDQVDGYVAMNVSPAVLLLPECTHLLRSGDLSRVLLELSEHEAVNDYPALLAVLAPLRADGMRLAIDDVGSGYSSLRHIVLTEPDVIKLDRSIVSGAADDPVIATLVRSLTEFGHACGARVVAEGIETAQDAQACAEGGVDIGQGWFFGRPGPPAALAPIVAPPQQAPSPGATSPAAVVPAPRSGGRHVASAG